MPLHKPAMLLHDTHTKLKGVERFLPFWVSFSLSSTCSFSATPKHKQCMSRFSSTSPIKIHMEKDAPQSPTLYALALRLGGGLLLFLRVIYTLFLELTVPTRNQSTKNSLRLVCPQIFSKKFKAVSFINSNLNLLLELFHEKLYIYNILITNYR